MMVLCSKTTRDKVRLLVQNYFQWNKELLLLRESLHSNACPDTLSARKIPMTNIVVYTTL